MANGTMANESIVREALHMPILCKDSGIRRRKGSSIKSSDILMPAAQRSMFFLPPISMVQKGKIEIEGD